MSRLVIDASAAVHLATMASTPDLRRHECWAPPLMWSEALSALHQAAFRGALPVERVTEALHQLDALPVSVAEIGPDHRRRALTIARSLGWAKTYDAEYVALARSLDCAILSVDRRLIAGATQLVEFMAPADLRS